MWISGYQNVGAATLFKFFFLILRTPNSIKLKKELINVWKNIKDIELKHLDFAFNTFSLQNHVNQINNKNNDTKLLVRVTLKMRKQS